ncbi:LytTR family two component transcriptional regulator [Pedobacter psychrotolerans]|uniref:DNA-binding response regulator n=1 Tax=Pedobacter psychrotolerans TaxID=1843235 RepID=A0A4R2H213_9SPHI|nr:LytTR family DNA-binding domain-containing protein [Pedobacter psychrotolerans]TCO18759.1 LytTR family two component transcriptional regulator [Pedobacter psychrotolerans]GGE70523.1 DNA-binding response regulator [Pedobacter psychrotolerans]
MLNCIIIDDEPHVIDLLEIHAKKIPNVNIVKTFNNGFEALNFLENTNIDLIFVDIQMPEISGLEFIKVIGKRFDIVIISAFREYAIDGYENEIVDFLLKPVSYSRFVKALDKANEKKLTREQNITLPTNDDNFIVLKTEFKTKLLKVDIDDIMYVEGLKNYVSVFTKEQRIITLLNMKAFEEKLPKNKFIRTHRSYIISLSKVRLIDGNRIYLKDLETGIPLGDNYRENFYNRMKQNMVYNK